MTIKQTFTINGESVHSTDKSQKFEIDGVVFSSLAEAIFHTATMPKKADNQAKEDSWEYKTPTWDFGQRGE